MEELRHSAAHVLATAVLRLFPEAKLAIGPPTEDGFYYDFLISRPFSPEDLAAIEERMARDIAASIPFQRREMSRTDAEGQCATQPFKLDLIAGIPAGEPISTYRHGKFEDLCEGPHVESTAGIIAFKLLSVAGAYWRGDEKQPMLQRIYGTAFESQEAMDDHLHRLEEAQRRDHRVLGRELGLFFFDPLAPASPFFMPKGALVYNLLMDYMRGLYKRYDYQEVITPQIFGTDLWKRSGHYDNYINNMYLINAEEREYGVKPMNCPAHCLMYMNQRHSYRELPIRYADFGRLHRFERSGVTHGLARVRSFSQDDAHIFCRMEQVNQEIAGVLAMTKESFLTCGLGEPRFTLSLRPEKRLGTDEMWDTAENALRDALLDSNYRFTEVPDEGAFYGPKIDLFAKDAIGREWQLSTIQLDINLPERFDLEYVAEDGSLQRPVIVHRAVLGSIERFLGVLIEHHAGAFPVWLAPVQAVIIPIADRHTGYAGQVTARMESEGLRVSMDAGGERMNAKVRDAQLQKIPYMLIVGDREAANGSVSLRLRSGENPGSMPLEEAIAQIKEAIAYRN